MKGAGAFALSLVIGLAAAAGVAVANPSQRSDASADSMSAMMRGPANGIRGMEEMHRFMTSERMPQAMSALMAMAPGAWAAATHVLHGAHDGDDEHDGRAAERAAARARRPAIEQRFSALVGAAQWDGAQVMQQTDHLIAPRG